MVFFLDGEHGVHGWDRRRSSSRLVSWWFGECGCGCCLFVAGGLAGRGGVRMTLWCFGVWASGSVTRRCCCCWVGVTIQFVWLSDSAFFFWVVYALLHHAGMRLFTASNPMVDFMIPVLVSVVGLCIHVILRCVAVEGSDHDL